MDKEQKRKEKVKQAIADKKIVDDSSFSVFQMTEDLKEYVDEKLEALQKEESPDAKAEKIAMRLAVKMAALEKGDKGDMPDEDDLRAIIEPLIPEPIKGEKGDSYVLSDADKKEIAKSIEVPIVEKQVEVKNGKDGVDGKTPVRGVDYFTQDDINQISLTALSQHPFTSVDDIKKGIGYAELTKNLEETRQMAANNSVPVTTSFFNGIRAKNLNIVGATASQSGDTVNLTVTATASSINGLISAGTNVTITGSGTSASPYVINSSGGGSNPSIGGTLTSATLGSVLFAGAGTFAQDNSNFYIQDNATTPTQLGTNTNVAFSVNTGGDFTGTDALNIYGQYDAYLPKSVITNSLSGLNTDGAVPAFTASSSRGTGASPAQLQASDTVGGFFGFGSQGASSPTYQNLGGMGVFTTGASANNLGGELRFYTKADGGTLTLQASISNAGLFNVVGTATFGTYTGQSSITTLGTITTGIWNGTAIANANLANSTISGVSLGGTLAILSATNSTLTFSGSYTGATAQTVGLNLSNANTWVGTQTFTTSVLGFATGTSLILTSTSANSLTQGQNGTTNPAFNVDSSTASSATGLNIKSAAAAGGLALSTLSSGTNESLTIDAKGNGTIAINNTSTTAGRITLGNSTAGAGVMMFGTTGIQSNNANAFYVGKNGITNPMFNVDNSTASAVTGFNIKGNIAGSGLGLSVISSGANENATFDTKGTGTLSFNTIGTGNVIVGNGLSSTKSGATANSFSGQLAFPFNSTTVPAILCGTGTDADSWLLTAAAGRVIYGYTTNDSNGNEAMLFQAGGAKGMDFYVNGTNNTFLTGTNAFWLLQDATAHFSAKITTYNGITTTGNGVISVQGNGRTVGATAAVANAASYTVGASDESLYVSANVLVTTSTLHNFTVTCAYTDEGNTARVLTLQFSSLAGTFLTAIANAAGTVPYEGVPLHIRCKAGSTVTIASAAGGTYTTVAYNIDGIITKGA